MEQFTYAERIFESRGWRAAAASNLKFALGDKAYKQGRLEDAVGQYKRGIDIIRRVNPLSLTSLAIILERVSLLFDELGNVVAARTSRAEALRITRRSQVHCAASGCNRQRREDGAPLDQCSRCLCTYYCSVECQTADWKAGHKKECKKLAEGRATQAASCFAE